MNTIKDGGPAFPNITPDMNVDGGPGMSLRDYFAAKAMHAEIVTTFSDATPEAADAFARGASDAGRTAAEHLAANAYDIADAMLKERLNTPNASVVLEALKGLLGLIQIITFRDDLPADLAASLKDNHRYTDADALVARIEGGQ